MIVSGVFSDRHDVRGSSEPKPGSGLLRASRLRSTSGLPTQKARVRRFFLDFAFFFLWAPGNLAACKLHQCLLVGHRVLSSDLPLACGPRRAFSMDAHSSLRPHRPLACPGRRRRCDGDYYSRDFFGQLFSTYLHHHVALAHSLATT